MTKHFPCGCYETATSATFCKKHSYALINGANTVTTTPKDDLPEARILPERITLSQESDGFLILENIANGLTADRNHNAGTEYIRADLCTPAIADGVGVNEARRRAAREAIETLVAMAYGIDVRDADEIDRMSNIALEYLYHPSTPPQAATDEG